MNELRPVKFDEIIGQSNAVETLKIAVASARKRNDALPHTLFEAGPGLGKTTLAQATAYELGADIFILNGATTNAKALIEVLMSVKKCSVVFVDEIHRLNNKVEELLYPVIEDFRLDVATKEYQSVSLPKFTLIGATTNSGEISRPLYDRFEYKVQIQPYSVEELIQIISKNCKKLSLDITPDAMYSIARRGRGTPRVVNSLLKRCRDYTFASNMSNINGFVVDKTMELAGIDEWGMTTYDRRYIAELKKISLSTNRAVGLKTLVDATGIDSSIVTEVIEPYLITLGLLIKSNRGRLLSNKIKI